MARISPELLVGVVDHSPEQIQAAIETAILMLNEPDLSAISPAGHQVNGSEWADALADALTDSWSFDSLHNFVRLIGDLAAPGHGEPQKAYLALMRPLRTILGHLDRLTFAEFDPAVDVARCWAEALAAARAGWLAVAEAKNRGPQWLAALTIAAIAATKAATVAPDDRPIDQSSVEVALAELEAAEVIVAPRAEATMAVERLLHALSPVLDQLGDDGEDGQTRYLARSLSGALAVMGDDDDLVAVLAERLLRRLPDLVAGVPESLVAARGAGVDVASEAAFDAAIAAAEETGAVVEPDAWVAERVEIVHPSRRVMTRVVDWWSVVEPGMAFGALGGGSAGAVIGAAVVPALLAVIAAVVWAVDRLRDRRRPGLPQRRRARESA